MSNHITEGAIKGGAVGALLGLGYAAADRPAEALLTTAISTGVGAFHGYMKHRAVSERQFRPKQFSDEEMATYNQWHDDLGEK